MCRVYPAIAGGSGAGGLILEGFPAGKQVFPTIPVHTKAT